MSYYHKRVDIGIRIDGMHQRCSRMQANVSHEESTSMMVSKQLLVGIKIAIPVKYWYLVGISRWESLCTFKVLYESVHVSGKNRRLVADESVEFEK